MVHQERNLNEPQLKACRYILRCYKPFSVEEISTATGINRTSIYTIIRRLLKKGWVEKVGEVRLPIGRGRPTIMYRLTSNQTKRQEVRQFVDIFSEQPNQYRDSFLIPNDHYIDGWEEVLQLEAEASTLPQEIIVSRSARALHEFEQAAHEMIVYPHEITLRNAHIKCLTARLHALRKEFREAYICVNFARHIFVQLHNVTEKEYADDLRLAIFFQELFDQVALGIRIETVRDFGSRLLLVLEDREYGADRSTSPLVLSMKRFFDFIERQSTHEK